MVREPKSLARLFARGGVNGMIFCFRLGMLWTIKLRFNDSFEQNWIMTLDSLCFDQ